MKNLINRIKNVFNRIKYEFSKGKCYNQMEDAGIAIFGMCSGVVGGDKNTNYLSYECIDCPYYTPRKEEIND